jgi:hypothetical protein
MTRLAALSLLLLGFIGGLAFDNLAVRMYRRRIADDGWGIGV